MNFQAALPAYWRLVTFRAKEQEFADYRTEIFMLGVLTTWLVGIGRYWDTFTGISAAQRLGLGSLVYIFVFGLFLWIIVKPFINTDTGLLGLIGLIGCASLPGIIYAFPIEMLTGEMVAITYNYIALICVSTYRVFFLVWVIRRFLEVETAQALVIAFLLISIIVTTIAYFGVTERFLGIMSGNSDPTVLASDIVQSLGVISAVAFPLLLYFYLRFVAEEGGYFN